MSILPRSEPESTRKYRFKSGSLIKYLLDFFFWIRGAWFGSGSYPRPDKYPKLIVYIRCIWVIGYIFDISKKKFKFSIHVFKYNIRFKVKFQIFKKYISVIRVKFQVSFGFSSQILGKFSGIFAVLQVFMRFLGIFFEFSGPLRLFRIFFGS